MKKRFKKLDNIVTRKVAEETLLVPISGNLADMQRLFVLDLLGEFIWEQLDGRNDLNKISLKILAEFEVEKEIAEADLNEFINQLLDASLIEEVL